MRLDMTGLPSSVGPQPTSRLYVELWRDGRIKNLRPVDFKSQTESLIAKAITASVACCFRIWLMDRLEAMRICCAKPVVECIMFRRSEVNNTVVTSTAKNVTKGGNMWVN